MHDLLCSCGAIILKSYGNKSKLRARIVLFEENQSFAKCLACGKEIKIPVSLQKSAEEEEPSKSISHYILTDVNTNK